MASGDRSAEDVETLARQMRFAEARALASAQGDLVRAFELALEARDAGAMEEVARAIAIAADPQVAARARGVALRRHDPFAEGVIAEASGALDDAVALYERAESHARAAAIHRARGDLARAGRALERQIKRDPTDAQSRVELAAILLSIGKPEPALRALAGLPDLDGRGDPRVRTMREEAHRALGLALDGTPPAPFAQSRAGQDTQSEQLLFGRYEVVRQVASTASSRVLEARDRLDPQRARVALKIFAATGQTGAGRDALTRFRREIDVLSRLDVPSVLVPRALLEEGPTLVLPWAGGGNVDDLLARGRPSARRAAEIVSRVLDALDAAHRRGIIHRDVKPANVLLDEAGGAYLADFGVAHLGDATATATAGVIGTLRYMAPEQRRGEPATPQSDLYALGVLFAELLGVDPFAADAPAPIALLLASLAAEDEASRPADAATVRARIDAIEWPDEPLSVESLRGPASLRPSVPAEPGRAARFVVDHQRADVMRDLLLDRDELLVRGNDPRLPLALSLARVVHPALPAVLGVSRSESGDAVRVEVVTGDPVSALTDDERIELSAVLTALHRAGGAHGAVARSLRRGRRGLVLVFPDRRPADALSETSAETATASDDLAALARIPRSTRPAEG